MVKLWNAQFPQLWFCKVGFNFPGMLQYQECFSLPQNKTSKILKKTVSDIVCLLVYFNICRIKYELIQ